MRLSLLLVVLLASSVALAQSQVVVVTEPSGAKVSIDGQPVGVSTVTAKDLVAGDHVIEVTWGPGKSETAIVKLQANSSVVVKFPGGVTSGGAATPPPAASANVCTPGQQVVCSCPGGDEGVQICDSTGSKLGACTCGQVKKGKGFMTPLRVGGIAGWGLGVAAALAGAILYAVGSGNLANNDVPTTHGSIGCAEFYAHPPWGYFNEPNILGSAAFTDLEANAVCRGAASLMKGGIITMIVGGGIVAASTVLFLLGFPRGDDAPASPSGGLHAPEPQPFAFAR